MADTGIWIDEPKNGANVALGATIRIAGGTDSISVGTVGHEHDVFPKSVTVSVGNGPEETATALAAQWASWETTFRRTTAGPVTITATATYLAPGNPTHTAKITVTAVPTAVTLVQPSAPIGTQEFTVQVHAEHPAGITGTRARVDGQGWVELGAGGGPGTLRLPSVLVPPGGHTAVVDMEARSGDGSVHTGTASVQTVDANDPVILAVTPGDGVKIPGTVVGANVPVSVTVRDAGPGQLTSGVSAVTVQVDAGTPVNAVRTGSGDPSGWAATVFVPGADEHTITVRTTDGAGRSATPVTHRLVVTARVDLRDLTRETYLTDLLAFTTERLRTGSPDGGTLPPAVTVGQLAEALAQDLPAVLRMPPADSAAPTRTLRLVTESLVRYMRPAHPAPVASWPLDDGQGDVAADSAGGLAQGTVEGATWMPGKPPTLRFDPAAAARVRVTAQASAQVRVRDGVTMVARIRPTASTAGPGVIVSKEAEYALSRFPDGRLHWALATAAPGWTWQDTGVVAPPDTWSHVAVAYDGAQVRTMLDGRVVHTADASGPITSVGGSGELWIGGRSGLGEHFLGEIADVAVFDRGLSEYEVHRLLGRSDDSDGASLWLDDDVPAGAQLFTDADDWDWVNTDPAPSTGARCHRSRASAGVHQHFLQLTRQAFPVDRGDILVTDVWVDPQQPPREVMLQWLDERGSWEHRAYWGEDLIGWGTMGTPSRLRIGDQPAPGQWVTLRVPARAVGLEHRTVHGLAFTLFDGRAAWDRTGRSTAPAQAGAAGLLYAAYDALTRAHGTSPVELRLARGAAAEQRAALAARLGIGLRPTRPDELDDLLLDPAELDATALGALFGWSDPLSGAEAEVAAELTAWRLAALRRRWRDADAPDTTGGDGLAPVVDPEVVVEADLLATNGVAARLLRDRAAWRAAQVSALRTARGAGGADEVAALLGTVLAGVDLDALAADRNAGSDITAALAADGLTLPGLRRLLTLRALAASGPLRDDEWEDLAGILVGVLRRRNWPAWRAEERTADVVVDGAVFRDSTVDPAGTLPPHIDLAARQAWLDRLAGRATAVQAVHDAARAAVAAADQARLPIVRDALVAALDPGIGAAETMDALTEALFVDVGAGPQDVSSRVEQALEAVQGVLVAARANRLATPGGPLPASIARGWALRRTPAYPLAAFDEEWQWMGTYAAWQAATSVFFRPELMLLPTLRPDPTPPFTQLRRNLTELGSDLTPQGARNAADAYRNALDGGQRAALGSLLDLVLTDQLAPAQVAQLAAGQQALFSGRTAIREIPRWQLEVFWLVPLQLAVALSRAGQHLSAIDWLHTLYADDQPPDNRIVFHGFRLEQSGSADLSRPQDWLLARELNPHRIADGRRSAQLRFTLLLLARSLVEHADSEFTADSGESRPRARALYLAAARALRSPEFEDPAGQQVPANPLLAVLQGRVRANLGKLRRGLTIAGIPRPAPPSDAQAPSLVVPSGDGAPTPPRPAPLPTPYRYATLVARAQQLLGSAAQVESSYLAALAGADQESYTEQRAADDLELTGARVAVQRSAAQIAAAEVTTVRFQLAKANDQARIIDGWIAGGESSWERDLLDSFNQIAEMKTLTTFFDAAITMFNAAASASPTGAPAAALVGVAAGARFLAASGLAAAEQRSQEASVRASWERRLQEWQLQSTLAHDDAAIASQQVEISKARSELAAQEQAVAEAAQRHAQSAVNFLAGRRLTGEMYAWMGGELGEVYRYLLRQATSVARLAEQQLAFERQQPPPATIKANYWTAATPGDGAQPDRRGLTGSARLLRDLTELDQHAFETNRRRLNLEHTFALSRTTPEAFAHFRRTGVLPFSTPMEAFDRRFPGHLLRTIRGVRLSLVALVPPAQGIAATLTCSGQSRVVVGDAGLFRTVVLTRPPETVAYTSPAAATGIFELDPQPELKFWFEDHGADTTWEFRLPKPANPIDYAAIAEVLVTIEYAALHDEDYARQVRATLPTRTRGTLALSIRDRYPDAWYTLITPDPSAPTQIPPVMLAVSTTDFPRNVSAVRLDAISFVVVRPSRAADDPTELGVADLNLVRGDRRIVGGPATTVNDVISSRLGSGAAWTSLVNPPAVVAPTAGGPATPWEPTPTGDWELTMAADQDTRQLLQEGRVQDIVLALSYRAELPRWPE